MSRRGPSPLSRTTRERIADAGRRFEIAILELRILDRPDDPAALLQLGELYSRARRFGDALAMDLRLVAIAPVDPSVRYNLACSQAQTGDRDGALRSLGDAVRLGYRDLKHMTRDPDLATVRELPGFESVLQLLKKKIRC